MPSLVKFTKYTDRVQLQDLTETIDSYGQPVQSWTQVADFWAAVQPLRGREQVYYRQIWSTAGYFVTFNWQGPDIAVKARMRVYIPSSNKTLNIMQVNQVPVERTYELLCEEHAE